VEKGEKLAAAGDPPSEAFSSFESLCSSHEKIIWSKLSAIDKSEDGKKRQLYRTFMKRVKELVGEQSDPAQTSASAVFLLKTLAPPAADSDDQQGTTLVARRQKLRGMFGVIEEAAFKELVTLTASLSAAIDLDKIVATEAPPPISGGSSKTSTSTPSAPVKREYGFSNEVKMLSFDSDSDPQMLEMFAPPKRPSAAQAFFESDQTSFQQEETSQVFEPVSDGEIDRTWLKRKSEEFLRSKREAGATSTASLQELTLSLCDILASPRENDEIQSGLFDLLGFDSFPLVESLLKNRDQFLETLTPETEAEASSRQQQEDRRQQLQQQLPVDPFSSFRGARVTVMTESEKRLQKQLKKEDRRNKKRSQLNMKQDELLATLGFDNSDSLRQKRLTELEHASKGPLFTASPAAPQIKYPHVFASTPSSPFSLYGTRFVLPVGTVRHNLREYEEVTLPESKRHSKIPNERTVEIDEFDEFARNAFKGYKSLNRLQSLVFDVAFGTNENMLVCAPTGAGKTDVAMMAVLNELKRHVHNGVLMKGDFKIVYVAPMKALAAEVVEKFSSRLKYLGVVVNELTGDMQMTKAEIEKTQVIVTTPEKWDVVTRKSSGDVGLAQQVKLLIIDEVHLLHDDRGPVIESLVARTLRLVESTQSMIRIVGLSATLPNFLDVAQFLRVNPMVGLFFFDNGFRPVPLSQQFIGIKPTNALKQQQVMNEVCYEKAVERIKQGYQVMIFVHSRKETLKTAEIMRDLAQERHELGSFQQREDPRYGQAKKDVDKARGREIKDIFPYGFSIHHAGMLRSDRNLVERLFSQGLVKVLVCTATLAWGVNLPAHTVIIKGTQIYNAEKGSFVDLGILDVMQIFGRAGRPQFDSSGEGIILTSHARVPSFSLFSSSSRPA